MAAQMSADPDCGVPVTGDRVLGAAVAERFLSPGYQVAFFDIDGPGRLARPLRGLPSGREGLY
jgi:hypothetical protein